MIFLLIQIVYNFISFLLLFVEIYILFKKTQQLLKH